MGYRGKLLVQYTELTLPKSIAEKYKEDYYIEQLDNGEYISNISSKSEAKDHYDIIEDLKDFLKGNMFDIYAVVLWEDGRVDRYNLSNSDIISLY